MADLPHSPAADRNKEAILAQLLRILGERGSALEIASGTGQPDPALLHVIAERVAQAGVANVLPPVQLDVTAAGWPPFTGRFDAIFCANMLHIAPWAACAGLMAGAARHLAPAGVLITYGPYLEAGVPTAPSNLAFDDSLRARDPAWGLRALEDVVAQAGRSGLVLAQRHAMPANNLLLVFQAA